MHKVATPQGNLKGNHFPPALLDEIRARLPVSQVVARTVKLKRAGRELRGLSPFKSERTPSFFVNDSKQRWFDFSAGMTGDIFEFVMLTNGLSFRGAVEQLAAEAGLALQLKSATCSVERRHVDHHAGHHHVEHSVHVDEQQRLCKARWLWRQRQPIAGSVAERYLRNARGYSGPLPATVGFLPATDKYPPALIAAFAFTDEPEPGTLHLGGDAVPAVHVTRLLHDGSDRQRTGNADKIMRGLVSGTPIVLAPPNDGLGLAITEGLEDGLSVYAATGLGVWAAGSAGFMPALADVVPAYIECVTIYQHDDEAGRRGSAALAHRLDARGVEVFITQAERV
jgi:hypothetical protein